VRIEDYKAGSWWLLFLPGNNISIFVLTLIIEIVQFCSVFETSEEEEEQGVNEDGKQVGDAPEDEVEQEESLSEDEEEEEGDQQRKRDRHGEKENGGQAQRNALNALGKSAHVKGQKKSSRLPPLKVGSEFTGDTTLLGMHLVHAQLVNQVDCLKKWFSYSMQFPFARAPMKSTRLQRTGCSSIGTGGPKPLLKQLHFSCRHAVLLLL